MMGGGVTRRTIWYRVEGRGGVGRAQDKAWLTERPWAALSVTSLRTFAALSAAGTLLPGYAPCPFPLNMQLQLPAGASGSATCMLTNLCLAK